HSRHWEGSSANGRLPAKQRHKSVSWSSVEPPGGRSDRADNFPDTGGILGFSEAVDTTSIYCLAFGDQGVSGLQGPFQGRYGISVRDLGEVPDAPVFRTRVD
ncbi:MAG: hypothetical protein ACK550_18455, partial [Synechococcaceae cyanobacterium]